MNKIINSYKKIFRENQRWLNATFIWFGVTLVIGVVTFFVKPDLISSIVNVFQDKFGLNPQLNFEFAIGIFKNNLMASLIGLFGGLVLGLGSILVIGLNGFILGFVIVAVISASDSVLVSLGVITGGVLPHAIFELSAFFLAGAFGLNLGLAWLLDENRGQRWSVWKQSFKDSLTVLPLIVVLLFLAALVEVFISGKIVSNF